MNDELDRMESDTAATPAAWASALLKLDIDRRVRVLSRLLGLVGPLALAVVAGGAFARYVRFARRSMVPVSFEDAARATASQIQDLVRYVHQSHPRDLGTLTLFARCAGA